MDFNSCFIIPSIETEIPFHSTQCVIVDIKNEVNTNSLGLLYWKQNESNYDLIFDYLIKNNSSV